MVAGRIRGEALRRRGAVALLNRAPHQNAARLLLNWLLSQDGQAQYSRLSKHNVRRLDVAAVNPIIAVDPQKSYRAKGSNEEDFASTERAIQIAKDALK
jgi:ABC-type Fe3+ transport system substrate-binding protein